MEQRDRILTKAHELYFRYGIRSVTMDEIAGQCGVSKKTIYQFFEDKDALVGAVVDAVITKTEGECTMDQSESENAIHEVFLSLDMVQELFSTMNPNILIDLQKHHPKAFDKLEKHKNQFFLAILRQNITRGKTDGLYRDDFNEDIVARMRLYLAFLPFEPDIFPKGKYSLLYVEQQMTEHFLNGIATAKGQKLIQKYKQERIKNQTS